MAEKPSAKTKRLRNDVGRRCAREVISQNFPKLPIAEMQLRDKHLTAIELLIAVHNGWETSRVAL